MQLESTFRKSHEMDAKYKEEAFQALANDSKNALIENSKLERVNRAKYWNEALLKRYNNQLVKHRELKVENEILVKKDRLQSNEVRSLKQERLAAEARVASLQENLNELNALQVHASKIEKKLRETENELTESKKLVLKLEVNAEKWKSRAFEMSQQMLEQSSSRVLASQGGSTDLPDPVSKKKPFTIKQSNSNRDGYAGNARAMWNSQYSEASPTRNSPTSSIPGLPLVASMNVHEEMGPADTGIVQSRFKYQNKSRRVKKEWYEKEHVNKRHNWVQTITVDEENETVSNFM